MNLQTLYNRRDNLKSSIIKSITSFVKKHGTKQEDKQRIMDFSQKGCQINFNGRNGPIECSLISLSVDTEKQLHVCVDAGGAENDFIDVAELSVDDLLNIATAVETDRTEDEVLEGKLYS